MTHTAASPYRRNGSTRTVSFLFFLLALLPVVLSFFLTTDGRLTTAHLGSIAIPMHHVCLFRLLTGYNCPVCGMTRTFAFMGHGQFAQAWRMSVPGVLLYLFCWFEIPLRGTWLIRGQIPRVLRLAEPVLFAAVGVTDAVFFLAQFIR